MKEFLKMMEAILRRLENPHRRLLGPNYWIMQKVGLILPKSKKWRYAYIFLHEVATLFVISQYMELYVIRADMQEVLTNLKVSMLSTVCVIKSNTFSMWQESWTQIMDYVTEADNFEREDKDDVKGKIIDRYTKYCRRVTYFYWSLVFITAVTVMVAPFMRYLSSSSYREEILNGTELFPQIFSSWMPVEKYHSPSCWFTVLWHVFICGYGASVTAAYDTSIVVIMVFFGGHLELLRERCKQMMGSFGRGISEAEAENVVRQIHTIHTLLKNNSTLFNSVLSPVMFLYVVMCSLMLCASAFQLTVATSATQKLLMAEYLIACVAQLFIFCWHSNDVSLKSENVDMGPYESEWWAASVRQRKSVLILSGQLRDNFLFTAGPFTNLTLSTFLAILKGSYSYYTLLRK